MAAMEYPNINALRELVDEKFAGVYDDDTGEECSDCGHYPCRCDYDYDTYHDYRCEEGW